MRKYLLILLVYFISSGYAQEGRILQCNRNMFYLFDKTTQTCEFKPARLSCLEKMPFFKFIKGECVPTDQKELKEKNLNPLQRSMANLMLKTGAIRLKASSTRQMKGLLDHLTPSGLSIFHTVVLNFPDTNLNKYLEYKPSIRYKLMIGDTKYIANILNTLIIRGDQKNIEKILKSMDSTDRQNALIPSKVSEDPSPLVTAIKYYRLPIMATLLQFGSSLDASGGSSQTPLTLAVSMGSKSMTDFLIKKGVNISAVDKERNTAMRIAVENKNLDIIKLLVDTGKVNFHTKLGDEQNLYTFRYFASPKSKIPMENMDTFFEVGERLIELTKSPNHLNTYKISLAHLLAENDYLEMLQFLKKHYPEVNLNFQDKKKKWTPLHFAANSLNVSVVKWLLENGADKELKNSNDETALEMMNEREKFGYSNEIQKIHDIQNILK